MVQVLKTQADFDREIKYEGLTVIDFFATWCGPCKVLAPKIDKFDEENETVHFFKIDVDESPEVSQENGITAMPTVLFFKNGEKVGTVVGANVQEISKLIGEHK